MHVSWWFEFVKTYLMTLIVSLTNNQYEQINYKVTTSFNCLLQYLLLCNNKITLFNVVQLILMHTMYLHLIRIK